MYNLRLRILSLLRMHPGWYALLAAIGLTLIGIEAIGTVDLGYSQKQTIWFVIALAGMPLYLLPRPRVIGLASYALLAVSVGLLIFVILPGVPRALVPKVNSTTAWIDLQFMRLQPSELAKITFVLAMAWYLRHRDSYRSLLGLLVPFVILLVPVGLILKQPDLGTALLFGPTLLVMLIAAGARLRHIGSIMALGLLVVSIAIASIFYAPGVAGVLFKPHQQIRFKAMVSQLEGDGRYDRNFNFQQNQSITLIGAGQFRGQGKQRARLLIDVHNLPEAHNDMIFAVIVNRWGLMGAWAVQGLYLVIVGCFALIAGRSRDPFARLAMVGFAGLLLTQATINMAVNLGLLPVTGITLPFMSYGGSSLVTVYAMMGLAMNFAALRPTIMTRQSFEFDVPDTAGA